MDSKILLSLVLVGAILFSGCVDQKVVCNKPYIRVGSDCCLDSNDNSICDSDEISPTTTTTTITSTTIIITTTTIIKKTTTTIKLVPTTTTTTISPECYVNSDCGVNGTKIIMNYICYQGDIHRVYLTYRCKNPGTSSAKCIGKEKTEVVRSCDDDERCIKGEPYCRSLQKEGEYELITRPNPTPGADQYFGWGYTKLNVNTTSYTHYREYEFKLNHLIKSPLGVFLHMKNPDGNETDFYCTKQQNTQIDDMLIGVSYISMQEPYAKIWVYAKKE